MTTEDHLTPTEGVRGLRFMPPAWDSYDDGSHVYVQDSSAVDPSIWLRANYKGNTEVSIHLRMADAWKLAEQIMFLARENGYDGKPPEHIAMDLANAFTDGFKAARAHPDWRLIDGKSL